MSTKTTFKRVALVAVAALGFGVLSVVPSQAVVSGLTIATTDGTATTAMSYSDTSTSGVVEVSYLALTTADTVTVTAVLKSAPATATTNSLAKLVYMDTRTSIGTTNALGTVGVGANGSTSTTRWVTYVHPETATGFTIIPGGSGLYAGGKFFLNLDTRTAVGGSTYLDGTYTYTIVATPYVAGAASTPVTKDVSIVVSKVASQSLVASSLYSTATMSLGSSWADTAVDSSVAVVATAASTNSAVVRVVLKNASQSTNAAESVTATITGPGLVGTGSTYGKSVVLAYSGSSLDIGIRPDGNAGTASIAISTPSVTFAPKSVTFFAKAASTITVSARKTVVGLGGATDAFSATIKDANGAIWGGAAYIYSSDTSVVSSATPVACTFQADLGVHYCPAGAAVKAGTAKYKVIDASTVATANVTSAEVSNTVSTATAATVKLSFDKATYAPGEKAYIYVTLLDKDGGILPAQTDYVGLAAGGITPSLAFSSGSDTLTATTFSTSATTSATTGAKEGAKLYTVYMPYASGDVTISATGGASLPVAGQVAVTAKATVVNSSVDAATDAANEATDAANAATDAANAAAEAADAATAAAQDAADAVAALSTQVNELISALKKQITSLTSIVVKIQKKLGVK